MKGMRRIFSGLLALAMVIAMLPAQVLAEEESLQETVAVTEPAEETTAPAEQPTEEPTQETEAATEPEEETQGVAVESVTIVQKENRTELVIGETVQLTVVILPEEASGETVNWYSSDEIVATVDENGVVTAVSPGDVTITAETGDVTGKYNFVIVEDIEVKQETVMEELLLSTYSQRTDYYSKYGITYEQLFTHYPQYLKSKAEDRITDTIIKQYCYILSTYGGKYDFIPSYITSLKEGFGLGLSVNVILSELGLSASMEEQWMYDTIKLLLNNINQNQTMMSVIASKINTDILENPYEGGKDIFKKVLAKKYPQLTFDTIEDIVDEFFKNADKIMAVVDRIGTVVDITQIIASAFEFYNLQTSSTSIIREAIPQNSNMVTAIDLFMGDIDNNPYVYFVNRYIREETVEFAVEYICDTLFETAFSVYYLAAKLGVWFAADVLYQGPDASDIGQVTLLSGYTTDLYSAVSSYRVAIRQAAAEGFVSADLISNYEYIYSAYIEAIRTTLEGAYNLAKNAGDKGNIQTAISLCESLTYEKYIDICMQELKADIDAGIVDKLDFGAIVTGLSVPTTLTAGSRFWLKGTVSTKDAMLQSVAFNVYNSAGTWITGGTEQVNGKSYTLDDSQVCDKTEFNKLAPGTYRCELVANVDTGITCDKIILYSGALQVNSLESDTDIPVADSADFISRSDGIWLWPLPQGNNQLNDWAGCQGNTVCPFHGTQIWCAIASHGNAYNVNGSNVIPGHTGIDVDAVWGTYVYAAADGILFCNGDDLYSRGIIAVIEHPLGNGWSYYSLYQHLSSVYTNLNRATVSAGTIIAKTGNSDGGIGSTGAHLHFSIYLGKSGNGEYYANYPNNTDSLFGLECKPWILKEGYSEGKIVSNPARNCPLGTFSYYSDGGATQSSFESHFGSVMYTYDKSQVHIGQGNVCSHNYSSTVTPATCTRPGIQSFTCISCGDSYSEPIDALGHDYKSVVIESTCGSIGYTTYTCSRCSDSYVEKMDVNWTEWSEQFPAGVSENLIETKIQYRFRDKETKVHESDSLEGWTLAGPTSYWSDYGPWSEWSDTAVSASDTTKVESRTVWGYYYYVCPNCGKHLYGYGTCFTWANGCGAPTYYHNFQGFYKPTSWDSAGFRDWYGASQYAKLDGEVVFKWTDGGTKTQYRSCTRELVEGYSFYRWGDWSSWSDVIYLENDSRQVETRTVYRYARSSIDHSYGDWEITRAATADSEGQEQRSCVCGDTQTRKLIPVALTATVNPTTVTAGTKPEDVQISLSASQSIGGAGVTDVELDYIITDESGKEVTLEQALAVPGKYTITPKIKTP